MAANTDNRPVRAGRKPAKGKAFTVRLDGETLEKFEAYRWDNRLEKHADVLRIAVEKLVAGE